MPFSLTEMCARHLPDLHVEFQKGVSSAFLDEQANSVEVLNELNGQDWDFVILQGQNYSTSGKYSYSIDGAVKLAKLARANGVRVILYPEFPRQGLDEYERIRELHESIAPQTQATIAPIGEAWEIAASATSHTPYAEDGNHASYHGNYLNAAVFLG